MYRINVQRAEKHAFAPTSASLRRSAKCALGRKIESAEITIRIVSVEEMTDLNSSYRHKNGPTNVLSFPFAVPEDVDMDIPLLGDIVVCADVINREAAEQAKSSEAHWAHMIVHGVFHLLGYDHEEDRDAEIMETLEIEIMQTLGFANPYEIGDNIKHYD